MPRKTVERVIGGRTYRITQLGSDTADEVLTRIILGASSGSLSLGDFVSAKAALRAGTKVGIVDTAGDGHVTFVDLASVYDDLLADALGDRLEWFAAAVEVTFGPTSAVRSALDRLRTALLSSISPKTDGGSSIASSSPSA